MLKAMELNNDIFVKIMELPNYLMLRTCTSGLKMWSYYLSKYQQEI